MKKKNLTAKIIAIVLVVIVLCAIAIYLGGKYYFADHFYPKSTINGVDVSFKTKGDALKAATEKLNNYVLTIKSPDGDMTLGAGQVGLQYTDTDKIEKTLEAQNESSWYKDVFSKHNYEAMGLTLDDATLQNSVNLLSCMNPANPQSPVDASIVLDETKLEYVIVPETIGNTIVPELLYEGVKNAMLAGEESIDLSTNEYYVQPKYFSTDEVVTKAKATLDQYMSTVINYEDMGCTFTLDKTNICKFITVSADFKIEFNKEVMKQFISDNISPVFNTVGLERTITTPGSGTFTISGGTYGWQVGLIDERAAMIENIKAGGETTRAPMYLQDAAVKDRTNDIGNTYVDVNIEKQHLWVVKDGKAVMDSDFVSGNVSSNHGTTKGVFMVEKKTTNYRMEDYNVTVKYWMPFDLDLGEGFHDASWRSKFGGSIYLKDGSHGCINLPPSFAKKLYEYLTVRYPVIVH